MKKLMLLTAISLTFLFCATAMCSAADIKQGGKMVVTYKDDISTLDPAIGYDWQNWSMIKSIFDGLMDYDPGTTNLRPGLAESYAVSDDGMVFTFKLRPGVKFHNGREMTADDVKYSFDRVTNPTTQSPGAGFFGSIKVTWMPGSILRMYFAVVAPPKPPPTTTTRPLAARAGMIFANPIADVAPATPSILLKCLRVIFDMALFPYFP